MTMDQTKQADDTLGAQLLATLLGYGLMGADRQHVAEQEAEAEVLSQLARELEARKMEQTISGLSPKMASAAETVWRMVKVAAAVNAAGGDQEKLALCLEQEGLDKEAFGALIGGLARAGGAALKGIGGAASAAGRLLPQTATQRFLQAGGEAIGPNVAQRAGGWLQGQGASLAQKGMQLAKAPAAAPLLSAATKAKMIGGGALLGAGYLGMKGMQAARDYMMQPTGSHQGPAVMHDVNQYGYPQY